MDNTIPLFNTTLSLNNVNNNFLQSNSLDSSYELIYDNLIFDSKLYNIQTPDTGITTSFNLQRLKLLDRNITNYITLGQINPSFNFLNGQTLQIPATSQSNLAPQQIDASAFFETATFNKGFLDITITNELPVNLKTLEFELQNEVDNSVVISDIFTNLGPNQQETKSVDLTNKTINKALLGVIKLIETDPSSAPVTINTAKGVKINIAVRELEPRSAVAAFPNQTVVDQDEGLVLDMGGPEIKTFKVASGRLLIDIESTIQENMTMDFQIPSATLNGVPLAKIVKLDGAPAGSVRKTNTIVDMTGYLLDFRGVNPNVTDTVNTFHQILRVMLDSSGRKVKITLNDSIRISYRLETLNPEYAVGYLGQTNDNNIGKQAFDLFKGISGAASVSNFKTTLIARNTIGVGGQITINSLEGLNIFSNTTVPLTSTIINTPIAINKPAFLSRTPAETTIELNDLNSNISNFIGNFPQYLNYNIQIATNPFGNQGMWQDFIYSDSKLQLFLRLQNNGNIGVSNLILRDTQNINFSNAQELNNFKEVYLIINAQNQFPVEASVEIDLLDAGYNLLTTIDQNGGPNTIKAEPNPSYGKIGVNSKLKIGLNRNQITHLPAAKYAIIRTKLNSPGGSIKLYNWQKINVKCNLQFVYENNY